MSQIISVHGSLRCSPQSLQMKTTSAGYLNVWQMVKIKILLEVCLNIALDIRRQMHELTTIVHQIRALLKGNTLLPYPQVKYE